MTARLSGLNPEVYLKEVLTKITEGHPINRIEELMPWRMVRNRSRDGRQASSPARAIAAASCPATSEVQARIGLPVIRSIMLKKVVRAATGFPYQGADRPARLNR
jgi:hypothetical protein